MTMGRNRKHRKDLPSRVYFRGKSYYFVDKAGKWHNLGRDYYLAIIKHAQMNSQETPLTTMAQIMDRYQQDVIPTKAISTQKTNIKELSLLRAVFGEMAPGDITPPDIYGYMDRRPPVRANREKALLSHVFSYAIRWGCVSDNPCKLVKRNTETPKGQYVEPEAYNTVFAIMPPAIQAAMDVALLTGLRQLDVLKLTRANCTDTGLLVEPHKTKKHGRKILFEWTQELRAAIKTAITRPSKIPTIFLIYNRDGQPYTSSGFQSVWQKNIKKAVDDGVIPAAYRFAFKDLRTTAASDSDDDNLLGHTNRQTLYRHYKRKPIKVKPIR